MKYLEAKKRAFMGITNKIKGFVRAVSGVVPLTLLNVADNDSIINYTISGASYQSATPTPTEPIEVESVGDLVEDTEDKNYGKYKITVKCARQDGKEILINIYLDEPLRKIDEYADYIDFENQKVVRNIGETLVTAVAVESTSEDAEMARFYFRIADKKVINDTESIQVLSSKLLGVPRMQLGLDLPLISASHTGIVVYFKLPKALIGGETSVLANKYLANNPITAYYIKNMPTETDVILPKLPTFRETTIYSAETKVQPSDMSVTYYSSVKGE